MLPDIEFFKEAADNIYDAVYFVDKDKQIIFWNRGAELLTGYRPEDVLGTRCQNSVLIHLDDQVVSLCDAGCPLATTMEEGTSQESELFIRHKDGHRIKVTMRTKAIRDPDGTIVGAVEIFRIHDAQVVTKERIAQLEELALIDPVTRLPNRRYTETTLQRQIDEISRYARPFGLLFIDVDHFKMINDTHGHEAGDTVLQLVSKTLQSSMRPFDFLGRWGGDEFAAIIINVTHGDLYNVADRSRRLVKEMKVIVDGKQLDITVSIGALVAQQGDTMGGLIRMADALMYQSKNAGRNRVSTTPPPKLEDTPPPKLED